MVNVGITTFGCDAGRSGIGRYTVNLIHHLAKLRDPANYHLYMFRDEREVYAPGPSNQLGVDLFPSWLKRPVFNIAWHQTRLADWCRERRHEVLFLPAGNRRLPLRVPCPSVGTVHDFSSMHVEAKYDSARMFYIKQVLPVLIRRLTHILTVSESSKRDIVEYCKVQPERVTVTPLAVDHRRYQRDPDVAKVRLKQRFNLDRPYLLYVSRIEHPGKNHVRLIDAFNRLKSTGHYPHRLVLAGGDWSGAEVVHKYAAASPFSDDIQFTSFIPEDDLIDLYTCADILVFPSLFEGFGLPILEAMASGVPVACANVSSLPEVGGEAATYFSPKEPDSIVDAVRSILDDQSYRENQIELGRKRCLDFTWESTAQKTYDALRNVAAN